MIATDFDKRVIDATSVALGGAIESTDKWTRIRDILLEPSELQAACEMALAFIRWSQDLKAKNAAQAEQIARLEEDIARKARIIELSEKIESQLKEMLASRK